MLGGMDIKQQSFCKLGGPITKQRNASRSGGSHSKLKSPDWSSKLDTRHEILISQVIGYQASKKPW